MCLWKGAIQIDPFQKTLNTNKCDVVKRKKLHTPFNLIHIILPPLPPQTKKKAAHTETSIHQSGRPHTYEESVSHAAVCHLPSVHQYG